LLEEIALAFHHGLAGDRANVAKAEDRGAVRDDGDQVALGRVPVRVVRIPLDLDAGLRDPGSVRERKVPLVRELLRRDDGNLARPREWRDTRGRLRASCWEMMREGRGPLMARTLTMGGRYSRRGLATSASCATTLRPAHASITIAPDAAEIAGPDGRSKGTDNENPTNAARSADTTDQKNAPRIVCESRSPVTAGSTRKLKTSITPAYCMAEAMTTPSVRYSSRSHARTSYPSVRAVSRSNETNSSSL
jgi:hypothetical protein